MTTNQRAFGAPTDGTRQMKMGGQLTASRKHKTRQRCESIKGTIDPRFKLLDIRLIQSDGGMLARIGQMRTQIEQALLHTLDGGSEVGWRIIGT